MTAETLYNALEICLQTLEQGGDLESCLVRFPDLAVELRPLLETAVQVRSAAVADIPEAALRRSKARVLQAAAEMREQAATPHRRWQLGRSFRLALASLAMIIFLLTGGTALVLASAGTLPGDSLYPVKRGWEEVRIILALDPHSRAELESRLEQQRLQEINQLYRTSRVEVVDFEGMVVTQQADVWEIAQQRVSIDAATKIEGTILPGSWVQVWGVTDQGFIKADRIRLLAAPAAILTPLPSPTNLPPPTPSPVLPPTLLPTMEPETATPTQTVTPTESPEPTETLTPVSPASTPKPRDNGNGNDNNSNDDNHNGNNDNSNSDDNGNG